MKYNIEGGINFYNELSKSLNNNDNDNNNDNECLISCMPLTENYVTLECNHKFNYKPLYKEICQQKFVYKTYASHTLNSKDMQKWRDSQSPSFIRCPYCRNIQFNIIPYYPEMNLPRKYGINSLELTPCIKRIPHGHDDYTFTLFGITFKKGICANADLEDNDVTCPQYVSEIPDTTISYCRYHYKKALKEHKQSQKNQEKLKQKEAVKQEKLKQKEAVKQEKLKQKEAIKQEKLKQKEAIKQEKLDSKI